MKKILPAVFIVFIFGFVFFITTRNSKVSNNPKTVPYLIINGRKINIEVADTPQKTAQGLSDRETLNTDWGMLFIFAEPKIIPFWMNRMKFNLDFVFINNKEIVDLAENIPFPKTGEQPMTVRSKKPFNAVLEINAGLIEKYGIKIGNQIEIFL